MISILLVYIVFIRLIIIYNNYYFHINGVHILVKTAIDQYLIRQKRVWAQKKQFCRDVSVNTL